ncbi:4-(cytidine 5'-diphospho)-2-C-methyl-D-erythritol kinase [Corynebacterium auriscanis]|uniref:4-(cytidine 5'-diphospho)-2-C-methyl-D-erythritol kinase n=1 Tax=Corynebacterium auriscanis TaxID=99807 RepID=UPI002245F20A|nr:4-(cytidine 5'-diphospho)-2-C-methyl-D-erythritol kinase [Corynebacterium auriscanis]MCX2162332.1 4-(cytidine 5'-diphospho)-2-C-methyl-D-erythritol kinase [Corynebacterium auriscanis]
MPDLPPETQADASLAGAPQAGVTHADAPQAGATHADATLPGAPQNGAPVTVTAEAYGKVNLLLGVGDARADGYHELTTVFQSVDLRETVTVTRVESKTGIQGLTADSVFDDHVPTDSTNLAWRAVELVREVAREHAAQGAQLRNSPDVGLRIDIRKGVPMAGGMAGGSADAAAAIVAAAEFFWPPEFVPIEELHARAVTLGADVPFCLLGGTALGTGIGEELSPILTRGTYHWVMVTNKKGLSTPTVFKKLDEQRQLAAEGQRPDVRVGDPGQVIKALRSGSAELLAAQLGNDLQAPAVSLLPELRETLGLAHQAGALRAIVSGSGPTVAVLCHDEDHAVEVLASITGAARGVRAVLATSPASGARVVART